MARQTLTIERQPDAARTFSLRGILDEHGGRRLDDVLGGHAGDDVIVDLDGVMVIDPAGFAALVRAHVAALYGGGSLTVLPGRCRDFEDVAALMGYPYLQVGAGPNRPEASPNPGMGPAPARPATSDAARLAS
jgi:anti-anti-sigma regulatory factor